MEVKMKNLVTYWTVKTAVFGGNTTNLFYRVYENAKAESEKDYRDRPVKHTVKPENCPADYAFED